ncbi:MAG: glycolate oxidase subunit GlcF [Alphaproteobacteria bacterium]
MQTNFSLAQLADPDIAESEKILRKCVHCGFCTATCPTYVLLGDELDSPRGRIYLIKDMLENDRPANAQVARHIDRCLSCLSCMTTCPSGVHYMHLVDHARAHVEATFRRPLHDRALRALLAWLLVRPRWFRPALLAAGLARPLTGLAGRLLGPTLGPRVKAMLALAPARLPTPSPVDAPQVFPAVGPRRKRVALIHSCANQVLAPAINEATVRLLTRHGVEVVIARNSGCCGALVHHMGKEAQAYALARRNLDAWAAEIDGAGLDAIVINISGCGTTVKDYGFMFRNEPAYAGIAATVSALTRDITEFVAELGLAGMADGRPALTVAYHAACSLQHGQQVREAPKALLKQAGFEVREATESHICCGSAGTYNLLQPAIASRLRDRKVANLERLQPDVIAAGNLGCMTQIGSGTGLPVVHTVELLDWATGGPAPEALAGRVRPH